MSTIKDVADLAGVSYATVSRILSQDGTFSASATTREKVLAAAQSLGYSPRGKAKKARAAGHKEPAGKKKIGCILHPRCGNDLSPAIEGLAPAAGGTQAIAPYFAEILEKLKEQLYLNQMELVFTRISTELKDSQELKAQMQVKPDGIIWIKEVDEDLFEQVNEYTKCHVGIDSHFRLMDDVTTEKQLSMQRIVAYLAQSGRKRIAFIGGAPDLLTTMAESARYQGYLAGLRQAGFPFIEAYARDSNWHLDKCYQQTCELLDLPEPPDAIMCANDNMAFSVFRAIYERQLLIPGDIAVTGYDNMPIAGYLSPPLTTIDIHKDAMVKTAAAMLLDRILGDLSAIRSVTYHADLIVRASS